MKRMIFCKIGIVIFFLSAMGLSLAQAVERRVPSQYSTIYAALEACASGDTVNVADGTYSGEDNVMIDVPEGVTLQSENGPDNTTINCTGVDRGYGLIGVNGILSGFTIMNANASSSVLTVSGNNAIKSMLTNCIIKNNTGLWIISCGEDSEINNCVIKKNQTKFIWNSFLQRYEGGVGGGICCGYSSTIIQNCLIAENTAESGGGIWVGDAGEMPHITNCTIINNTAVYGGGICSYWSAYPIITNTIIRNNNATTGPQIAIGDSEKHASGATIQYCNVQGGESDVYLYTGASVNWGNGNIDKDPKFENYQAGEYHLLSNSPCRDSGYNTAIEGVSVDLDGNSRIVNTLVDMGCYEYQGAATQESGISFSNTKTSIKNGTCTYSLKGTFSSSDIIGKNLYIKIGSYETTIDYQGNGFTVKSSKYIFAGSMGGICLGKFDLSKGTFTLTGKCYNFQSLGNPASIEVAFVE